jgi:hypothetical protein
MPIDWSFLDYTSPIYDSHKDEWEEEERRLEGGKAILAELTRFESETTDMYAARQKQATYINFPKAHAATITGQLRMHAPTPEKGLSFGELGEIRSRDQIDEPTLAELAWYNVDGVGQDGSEWPAWFDDVDVWAQATGHRWLMVEAPRAEIQGRPSVEQVRNGMRLFAVHRSPLAAQNWLVQNGQLQWIVFRDPMEDFSLVDGAFTKRPNNQMMYYVLVRQGYEGLGAGFKEGGWWRLDPQKRLFDGTEGHRTWQNTNGQIPAWPHYGHRSRGTYARPSLSRSSTMELGQIAVSTMQAISARDYDFWRACESKVFFLGADPEIMAEIAKQKDNVYIGVPLVQTATVGQMQQVAIFDASTGAVAANVSQAIITAKFDEAREQSFQQITSTPDNSGVSKAAGFNEQKAPYLATRAALRQQSENTAIYFWELRSGYPKPKGYSVWPREFDLAPLVDDIDAMFTTLRMASGPRSPTLEASMVLSAAQERGVITDPKMEKKIEAELQDSASAAADSAQRARDALAGITPADTAPTGGRFGNGTPNPPPTPADTAGANGGQP